MKKLMALLLSIGILGSAVVVAAEVDANTVTMEKRHLEEKLASLENRCRSSSNPGYPGHDWCQRGPNEFRARIQELESDPEYYFYKKEQKNQNKKPHGSVIDPNTGRVIGVY